MRFEPSMDALVAGIQARDRALLGRALTLVEGNHPRQRARARALLQRLATLPQTPGRRIGISGPPGAGKSTFIDALGHHLAEAGHHVAVLAIDPSSIRTGGSILGDKTRMARLSAHPRAFIRPSPAGRTLGGLAARTREAALVMEAAGYDTIFIETVGVGQSEVSLSQLADLFVLLMLSGAGDELQGIKRGVMEVADLIFVTKADGDGLAPAKRQAAFLRSALRFIHGPHHPVRVQPISALEAIAPAQHAIDAALEAIGPEEKQRRRQAQTGYWFWSLVEDQLQTRLHQHPEAPRWRDAALHGTLPLEEAAQGLIDALFPPDKPG